MDKENFLIGIVGPCKSGKTVLKEKLEKLGYQCRHIAQEHSYVPSMWQKLTNPDLLIYLDVSYKNSVFRGKLNWKEKDYQEQLKRLEHAREHADIYINTNPLNETEVLKLVLEFIKNYT